jgi:hypothetical protein
MKFLAMLMEMTLTPRQACAIIENDSKQCIQMENTRRPKEPDSIKRSGAAIDNLWIDDAILDKIKAITEWMSRTGTTS